MHTIVGSATSGAALAAVLAIATAGLGARPAAAQGSGAAPARPRVQAPASPKVLDARLAQARAEATRLAAEQRTLLTRLRQIELAIETRELEREKTARARTVATAAVDAAVDRVAAADAELAALMPEVRARLARLYRLMPLGYDRLLFSLEDARTFDRAARVVAVLARRDREQLERFTELRAARAADVARLQRDRETLDMLTQRLAGEEAALAENAGIQQRLLADVRERRDLNAQLVRELAAARDRLEQSMAELTAERGASSVAVAAGGRLRAGTMTWPVPGRVEARFGRQPSSRFGTMVNRNGIDIGAESGLVGEGGAGRDGGLRRRLRRLRAGGHRRSRRPLLHPLRPSGLGRRLQGSRGPGRGRDRHGRDGADRHALALFRGPHRRSAGRSRTMAEARLVPTARVKPPPPRGTTSTMTTRTRWIVLLVSTPVVAFVVIGSLLGRTLASQGAYEHLRVFEDVVSLVTQNYVEPVNVDKVMSGAMRGLADGLDADSAYLTPEQVRTFEADRVAAAGTTGLELTRGYYLRVVSARDGSPAARAGLRTGDYVRAINGAPTRNMSALEGMRLLRGAVGSKVTLTVLRGSATDPRDIPLVREAPPATDVTTRVQAPGVGYVRVAAFATGAAGRLEQAVTQLARSGATSVIVDLRDTAEGRLEEGIAAARPFVPAGKTLSTRETKAGKDTAVTTTASDGKVTTPLVLLTTNGTSGAAELFAAALLDNKRATLVGEHTLGRAGVQKLVKLPDGSALYMTYARYLGPSGASIHGTGLTPTVDVEEPEREFGAAAPTNDPILEKALEQVREKKAA